MMEAWNGGKTFGRITATPAAIYAACCLRRSSGPRAAAAVVSALPAAHAERARASGCSKSERPTAGPACRQAWHRGRAHVAGRGQASLGTLLTTTFPREFCRDIRATASGGARQRRNMPVLLPVNRAQSGVSVMRGRVRPLCLLIAADNRTASPKQEIPRLARRPSALVAAGPRW